MDPSDGALVSLRGISKRYGTSVANHDVHLDLFPGEIHVLLGENGAGKSTLMNILFGHVRPDDGQVVIRDEPVTLSSPRDAIARGIGMVHQHFTLVPEFTVAQNVVLGHAPATRLRFPAKQVARAVERRAEQLGMPIDPDRIVGELPVDLQQRVEIIKALYLGADVLVLDEPTALLGPAQIDNLLALLATHREQGCAVVLVTHKLAEVESAADRVTVIRQGEIVHESRGRDLDRRALTRAMTGHDIAAAPERSTTPDADQAPVLAASGLVVETDGQPGNRSLDGVSLEVRAGEILGIAGVEGNGQAELVQALVGLTTPDEGQVLLEGVDVTAMDPVDRRRLGIGVVPQDRQGWGLFLDMTLAENLAVATIAAGGLQRRGFIDERRLRANARRLLEEFDVRPPDPDARAGSLSGGNQQKVVLARELSADPAALVADNPTWGLDVGAIDAVHRRLLRARDAGSAIVLVSLDLDEIVAVADRIVVLYRGRVALDRPITDLDRGEVALAMSGHTDRTSP